MCLIFIFVYYCILWWIPYTRTRSRQADSHFQHIIGKLPGTARDVYYRDIIGNISSSVLTQTMSESTLDLSMRFPLYGGWKTNFYIGYNLPISGFVDVEGDRYRLTIDLGTPFGAVNTDELTVRVILPEVIINVFTAFDQLILSPLLSLLPPQAIISFI